MKKDTIDSFGKGSADALVAGVSILTAFAGAKVVIDLFQQKKRLSLNYHENIYAFFDGDGDILLETINKNGQGVLVARNYKSSDGTIYQETSEGYYRQDSSGWTKVNI